MPSKEHATCHSMCRHTETRTGTWNRTRLDKQLHAHTQAQGCLRNTRTWKIMRLVAMPYLKFDERLMSWTSCALTSASRCL